MGCTTILVGKKASYDGSTMIARNDDSGSGHYMPKKFVVVHPEEQPRKYKSVISHLVDELERVADAAIFMKDGILANQCMVEELRINQHKSVVDLYREIYGHGGEEVC